jgi:hypothetical protein
MFQKALQFKDVTILYYNMQDFDRISEGVPSLFILHILKYCGLSFSYCECLCFEPI